jgi:DNA-binding response OmpR family regulator
MHARTGGVVRILVVDSNVQTRVEIVHILMAEGYETIEAEDGNEASRLFRQHDPEMVITAVVMPNKDGLELISELRRGSYQGPIIVFSDGNATFRSNYLRLARMMGADASLAEPFSATELVATIDQLLGAASGDNARGRPTPRDKRTDGSLVSDVSSPSDPLVLLPALLESAREILAGSDARGDPEIEAMLTNLEECVVGAHRLILRRRILG